MSNPINNDFSNKVFEAFTAVTQENLEATAIAQSGVGEFPPTATCETNAYTNCGC